MLISSSKALSPLASLCIDQHCRDMILMFAGMEKKPVLLLGCRHYSSVSNPTKIWRGRRKENTPQAVDNILYLLRNSDQETWFSSALHSKHSRASKHAPQTLWKCSTACHQAMPIWYDLASNAGGIKAITVISSQFPSYFSLSISVWYYVYLR